MENKVFSYVEDLLAEVKASEQEHIEAAAQLFADSIINGGIIQAFGAGHSNAGALELTHRAGGFIPTKNIKEPAGGAYEVVEGVGTTFMKKVDVREHDVVVVISNSGRNPLPLEIALGSKAKGAKVIAVTSLTASKGLTSRHSSGKRLFEGAGRCGHKDLRNVHHHHGGSHAGRDLPGGRDYGGARLSAAGLQVSEH